MRGIASRLNAVTPAAASRVDQLAVHQRLQHPDQGGALTGRTARAARVGRDTITTTSAWASSAAPSGHDPRAGLGVGAVGQRGRDRRRRPATSTLDARGGRRADRVGRERHAALESRPCSEGTATSTSARSYPATAPAHGGATVSGAVRASACPARRARAWPRSARSRPSAVLGQRDLVPAVQQPLAGRRRRSRTATRGRRAASPSAPLEVDRGRLPARCRAARARRARAAPPAAARSCVQLE